MTDLGQPDWLISDTTRKIVDALETARAGAMRFVGGCVRNTLMQRPVDDIDIATQLTPDAVTKALETADIRVIPTGIEHGTVTAVCDSIPFEITTLRRDVETDGRRAVVAFTEDWREDAMRRDFRLNALYADPDGRVHDPVGGGIEDAAHGRVIFIGNGDERLREDYLRILRFFRFNAWYGAGIDADGLAACERQKEGLEKIAAERIWKELKKLLGAPEPAIAVEAMSASGILDIILPWNSRSADFEKVSRLSSDAAHRFMALLPRNSETVSTVASKLRLSNKERDRLETWSKTCSQAGPYMQEASARAFIYEHGDEAYKDAIALHPDTTSETYAKAHDVLSRWDNPEFPLRGDDALAMGLSGQAIGHALRAAELEWVESNFSLSRDELLGRLRQQA